MRTVPRYLGICPIITLTVNLEIVNALGTKADIASTFEVDL